MQHKKERRNRGYSPKRYLHRRKLRPDRKKIRGIKEFNAAVDVPDIMKPFFSRAQRYVHEYFQRRSEDPFQAMVDISGERYILVRAASMSKEFFDLIRYLYQDRGEKEAIRVAMGFLFDISHSIGKADARSFHSKMKVKKPLERLSAGPIHFAYTGWAYVRILPDSHPTPDEDYFLIYDHDYSFEAHTWIKSGIKTDFPVCIMNAGYSSGWCEESFGISLVAVEIECRARGDDHCRFIMASPQKIEEYLTQYRPTTYLKLRESGSFSIPEFFQRKRLEEELLKSEETVKALLNAPKDRAMLLDTDGNILALNRTAADFIGQDMGMLIGKNVFSLLPEGIAEKIRSYHEQVLKSGRSVRYEHSENGRWLDTTVDPVRDSHGKIARIALVSRDITEYKRIQEALQREKELTTTLIQISPAFFVALDEDGNTLLMNEAMLNALGYGMDEVRGRNYIECFVPEPERQRFHFIFKDTTHLSHPKAYEGKMITKDGNELIVEWHFKHVFKQNGELDFFFALGVDITQRKRAEEELRRHKEHLEELVRERTETLERINKELQKEIIERIEAERALQKSETMLRAIFDQTFQFIAILRLDGTVIKVNKTAIDLVNAKEEEIEGKPFWDTPWWIRSQRERERLKEAIREAAKGRFIRYETVQKGKNGGHMNVDFSLKPVRDKEGEIVLLLAEGRDITGLKLAMEDLKKREKELKIQSKRLEEANVALKVLIKQMEEKKKEDRENILANIKQLVIPYLNRLKTTLLSKEQKLLVEMVQSNLQHIASPLVTKLSSNFLNLTPMEIRIANMVKEGLSNKEIADILGTSLNTIISHRYKIRTKLGIKNKGINLRSYLLSL